MALKQIYWNQHIILCWCAKELLPLSRSLLTLHISIREPLTFWIGFGDKED